MNKRANEIIGETLGINVNDVSEARYQATRTAIPVYTFGNEYFCCPAADKRPPAGWTWTPYKDQFFAGLAGRVVYVAAAEE